MLRGIRMAPSCDRTREPFTCAAQRAKAAVSSDKGAMALKKRRLQQLHMHNSGFWTQHMNSGMCAIAWKRWGAWRDLGHQILHSGADDSKGCRADKIEPLASFVEDGYARQRPPVDTKRFQKLPLGLTHLEEMGGVEGRCR